MTNKVSLRRCGGQGFSLKAREDVVVCKPMARARMRPHRGDDGGQHIEGRRAVGRDEWVIGGRRGWQGRSVALGTSKATLSRMRWQGRGGVMWHRGDGEAMLAGV
eukprot:Gb_31607 [translate_table: standard]